MQNKPNFRKAQMNVNSILTKDYERNDTFAVPENKANSNPNKPNQSQYPPSRDETNPNQTQFQRQKNAEFKVPPLFQKNTGQDHGS